MSSPLLLVLAQVDPTATALAQQAAAAAGMDFYAFVLALLDRPAVVGLLIALTGLITWQARRIEASLTRTRAEVGVLSLKHDALKSEIDGKMTKLIEQTDRAARAEGRLEGATEVASTLVPPVVAPPVQVQVAFDPDARPGGKRRLDPPGLPASPPPEVDPESHP